MAWESFYRKGRVLELKYDMMKYDIRYFLYFVLLVSVCLY